MSEKFNAIDKTSTLCQAMDSQLKASPTDYGLRTADFNSYFKPSTIMKLFRKKRFFFWRVFWLVLAVYVFLLLIAMITSITMSEGKPYDFRKLLEIHHLLGIAINVGE